MKLARALVVALLFCCLTQHFCNAGFFNRLKKNTNLKQFFKSVGKHAKTVMNTEVFGALAARATDAAMNKLLNNQKVNKYFNPESHVNAPYGQSAMNSRLRGYIPTTSSYYDTGNSYDSVISSKISKSSYKSSQKQAEVDQYHNNYNNHYQNSLQDNGLHEDDLDGIDLHEDLHDLELDDDDLLDHDSHDDGDYRTQNFRSANTPIKKQRGGNLAGQVWRQPSTRNKKKVKLVKQRAGGARLKQFMA